MNTQYLALLRGINVGGNNLIKMADLKAHLEGMGLFDVRTYIQSGNVIFGADGKGGTKSLAEKLEKSLSERFGYKSLVVVITQVELAEVVKKAPKGFGSKPDEYRYDVLFVRPPKTPKEVMAEVSAKEGVDTVNLGPHNLYFSRLIARATSSHLNKIVGTPIYKDITIRNWNTTTKLLALMENQG